MIVRFIHFWLKAMHCLIKNRSTAEMIYANNSASEMILMMNRRGDKQYVLSRNKTVLITDTAAFVEW